MRVAGGRSLLMLLPSEKEAMLKQLEDKRVPIRELRVSSKKTQPLGPALQALLSKDIELKVRMHALQPVFNTFDRSNE
jgi:ATP-dependent RNA helicase DDX10/DBP4